MTPVCDPTKKLRLPLTLRQHEANHLLRGSQRHTILVGGARIGKTFLLCRAIMLRAIMGAGSRHAILRFRANAARQSIWLDTLQKVARLCYPEAKLEYRERDGYIKLINGSEIRVGGLDDKDRVEKILGQEYATVYFNECSQIGWYAVTTALTRLAQKVEGLQNRACYDLNPTGTGHWTYKLFVEKRKPDSLEPVPDPDNYAYTYLNPNDNARNIDDACLSSLAALPERQCRRFFEGQYVAKLDNALWSLDLIEHSRVAEPPALETFSRIVVSIDPSGVRNEFDISADEVGIVIAGISGRARLCVRGSDRPI